MSANSFPPATKTSFIMVNNSHSFLVAEASPNIIAQSAQNPNISAKPKRAPKAMTMSAKKWAPCKNRIQQLYVAEHRPLKYVRETVNREFALSATWVVNFTTFHLFILLPRVLRLGSERQYKCQIEKWNLERNVKQHERKYIVKKIQYRKQAMGKDTGYVSVRGHRITAEKLDRWTREPNNSMLETNIPRKFNQCTVLDGKLALIKSRITIWNQHPY